MKHYHRIAAVAAALILAGAAVDAASAADVPVRRHHTYVKKAPYPVKAPVAIARPACPPTLLACLQLVGTGP